MTMLPDCTPAVTRALESAQQWARRVKKGEKIRPIHLFASLLDEEEGQAAMLLRRAGFDGTIFREIRSNCPTLPLDPVLWPLHSATLQALTVACHLAAEQAGERTVSSVHLVLALLQSDQEVRDRIDPAGSILASLEAEIVTPLGPPLSMEAPLELEDEPVER